MTDLMMKLNLADFGDLFRKAPASLDDQELLSLDFNLHQAWQHKRDGGRVDLGDKPWEFQDIITLHATVKGEMSKRGFKHLIHDELDQQTDAGLAKAEPPTAQDDLEKGVRQAFGSYAGKKGLAGKICSYIPYHRTYVEPFAGGAAVFWRKDPSPIEVLNDRDSEIAFMYRFIRDHTPADLQALAKRDWIIRRATHERLKGLKPQGDRDRFYKSFYLTRSSYGKQRGGSFNPANEGVRIDFERNISGAQARLKDVAVHGKDYRAVLKQYDGPETFFYMDPPYPGTYNLSDLGFKEEQFLRALKGLKARWIVSYTAKRAGVFKGYNVYRVKRRNQMRGPGGNQEWVTELLVSNFPLKPLSLYIEKGLETEPEGCEALAPEFLTDLDDSAEIKKINSPFVSPGGKRMMARKIIELLPGHKTYVEPFAGAAHVLFHKAPSELEVLNDVNPDLMFAYRFVKGMTEADLEWLRKQSWVISDKRARDLFELKPKTPRERFYRFSYLNKAHYWGRTYVREGLRRAPSSPHRVGATIGGLDALPKVRERLAKVRLHSQDWKGIIQRFDGPHTLFFIDPPYPSHWPKEKGPLARKWFDEADLVRVLKGLKGRFMLSYELEKAGIFKSFHRNRIRTVHTGTHQLGNRREYELLVSNFPLKQSNSYVLKADGSGTIDPIYNVVPPRDRTYRYVIQAHWRGRSVHHDLRLETADKDSLIGWTLATAVEGVVEEPVETLEQAREWSRSGKAYKIDFKSGKLEGQVSAFPKAIHPHLWLEAEGVTPPHPAPGSTPQHRGVLLIEDQGEVEYGRQEPDLHEYILAGHVRRKLEIRLSTTPGTWRAALSNPAS